MTEKTLTIGYTTLEKGEDKTEVKLTGDGEIILSGLTYSFDQEEFNKFIDTSLDCRSSGQIVDMKRVYSSILRENIRKI